MTLSLSQATQKILLSLLGGAVIVLVGLDIAFDFIPRFLVLGFIIVYSVPIDKDYQYKRVSLIVFGARYYDPTLGRWTQRDPSGQDANP